MMITFFCISDIFVGVLRVVFDTPTFGANHTAQSMARQQSRDWDHGFMSLSLIELDKHFI